MEYLKRRETNPAEYQLDEVVYCDIGMDFPAMIDHVNRCEKIFTEHGVKFTRLKSERSFEYMMFEYEPKRKNPKLFGLKGLSWPTPKSRWCTGRLKTDIIDRYNRRLKAQYNVISIIGLAADEQSRIERPGAQGPNKKYPLAEWGWTEKDCLQYCYDMGFGWGGLYEVFHRVSCYMCPLQPLDELRKLRTQFPDLWAKMLDMERNTWGTFKDKYDLFQLDKRFEFEEQRLKSGKDIKSKEFFTEMHKYITQGGDI